MVVKRFRQPKLKEGELRVYWGRLPYDEPDVVYAYQGDRSMSADIRLVNYHLARKKVDPFTMPMFSKMDPSLLEELESRGYDITTLRFSIMKNVDPSEGAA